MASELRRALSLCLLLTLGGCYDGDVTPYHDAVVVGREKVAALAVSGDGTVIETGTALQLAATGTTTGGGSVDLSRDVTWSSSAPTLLAVDDRGRVTALANGTATITATLSTFSAAADITASDAALTAITVSGPATVDECGSGSYTASGLYADATNRDITSLVSWSVTDSTVARMSTLSADRNALISKLAGTTGVVASRNGIDATALTVTVADNLTALDVTPATPAQLMEGDTQTFTATGTWGTTSANISRAATWSVANADSSAPTVATVANGDANPGRLTAQNGGKATLTASCGGLADTADVTVVYLSSLAITNTRPIELHPGATLLLVLEGTYSDASTKPLNESATWTVALVSGTAVTVSNIAGSRGTVTAGNDVGNSTVTAKVDDKTVSVTVSVVN